MTKKNESIISNNLYLLSIIFKCAPGRVLAEICMRTLDSVSWLFMTTFFIEYIIESLDLNRDFKEIVIFIVLAIMGILLTELFISFYNRMIAPVGNQKLYEKLNIIMFEKVNDIELGCYENTDFYNKYTKAASQTKGTALKLIDTTSRFFAHTISLLIVLSKLLFLDWCSILICIIPVILSYNMQKRINIRRYEFDMENTEFDRQKDYVNRIFYQSDYAKELRLSNIQNVLYYKFQESIVGLLQNIKKYGIKLAILSSIQGFVSGAFITFCFNMYAIIRLIALKNIQLSEYVILGNLMIQLAYHLSIFASLYARLPGYSRYIENLRGFLAYVPKISQSQMGLIPEKEDCLIKLKEVTFAYSENSKTVLKNINMEIKPREKIALVGHNGAGKSTLVKLLMRLYDVNEGVITLNNTNIKDYNVRKYRELFGVVFQDYKVFSLSVADNILMREAKDEDKELVEQSLKLSGVYDKIQSLEYGINTTLTREFDKDGVVLSGGETQKVAIARLYAKPCKIAILDEPSSALDPIAEYQMYQSMMEACKDKSVVFISHRMSSAVLADKIYLLDNGEIIESGTHLELMNLNGKYAQMFRMQAVGYQGRNEI